jgi:DNA-binding Lrp family transcriptional regulator
MSRPVDTPVKGNKRNFVRSLTFLLLLKLPAVAGIMAIELDETDWRILRELQADGRITNIALASRIGLSPPPCLRRVRALEEAGLISRYTALVDEVRLGYALTAFAMVRLHNQAESDLRAFENRILGWPLVREAYMLSGESDFILKCVARDLQRFQSFVLDELTAAPNVASVKTYLTIRRAKRESGVPITVAGPEGT